MKNKTTYNLILSSLLVSILFVQEELLTFIPGVQFTFLLLMIIGAVMGMKWGTLIVICHVILDNVVMGSLVPNIMIPMFLGYEITLLIGFILKEKKLWLNCIGCILSIIIYTQLFALSSIIFLDIDYLVYMTGDISFTVILIIFSTLTIIWLYKPLIKLLNKIKNEKL